MSLKIIKNTTTENSKGRLNYTIAQWTHIVRLDVTTQLKIQLETECGNGTLDTVEKFQIESFRSEGIRKDGAQICDLDLEILNPDQIDVQIRIELAHELTACAARAAEVPLQLGRDGDGRKLNNTLKK